MNEGLRCSWVVAFNVDIGQDSSTLQLAVAERYALVLVADSADIPENEGTLEPPEQGLPEGFFDDPDADAKARGIEAPSVRVERELEEGMKKFEEEMAQETERAESTRHEIDEKRYEEAAGEEREFQLKLEARLRSLRKEAQDKVALIQTKPCELAVAAPQGSEPDEDSGASDGDVEFDWRAKAF